MNDGLINNEVLSIAGDAEGRIWLGTKGGVSVHDGSSWTTYTEADGLAGNTVYAIAFDPDGSAWLGTNKGASHYSHGQWLNYK